MEGGWRGDELGGVWASGKPGSIPGEQNESHSEGEGRKG